MFNLLKSFLVKFIPKSGYITFNSGNGNNGYIPAPETISAARKNNLAIREYVELQWDQQGCTEKVINNMQRNGCFINTGNILEIGPGTGRYLDLIINQYNPVVYEIYETAKDWEEYLVKEYYPLVRAQPADGKTLNSTPDNSCNIIHAHGVFVYLKYLQAFEYFSEMCRVCAPRGFIIFDFYSEKEFDVNQINKWLSTKDRYAVILNYSSVIDFFKQHGFELAGEFMNKHGHGYSRYFIFKNIL